MTTPSDTVEITLSNPLTNRYASRLGLDPNSDNLDDVLHNVGETVTVRRDAAMSIIGAGYAQVDPEDPAAVREALGLNDSPASAPVQAPLDPAPAAAAAPDAATPDPDSTGNYDPSQHTVEEVQQYLSTANADEQARVLDAERAGKNRTSLVG